MVKFLIGGSPCTHWSIAQSKARETEPEGIGWELFKNYLIAKEKFQPDFFLYENNKSAAEAIKSRISEELGTPLQYINSALVSAQNRWRFYAHNIPGVEQPEDRHIMLADILESVTGEQPIPLNAAKNGKAQCLRATCYKDGMRNMVFNTVDRRTCVVEPVRVCNINGGGMGNRIYSINGKSCAIKASGGGLGGHCQGLYAIPAVVTDKENITVTAPGGSAHAVYKVQNERIVFRGEEYPIKLADGFYIIRKLTVKECCRLQTLPDDYCRIANKTNAYKGLGNGWTAEVIIHILSHALAGIPKDEEIVILSMYDGIGTGRYCFDKLGYKNIRYFAYEIEKPAMKIAGSNFPDIVQCGDAFSVRESGWGLLL